MACRGRGEGQGFVRGRWWLSCSADGDNILTDIVTTSVPPDQGHRTGLSVKQDTHPCSNILRWHSSSISRMSPYIASTPAFCIHTCFENSTALLSVGWKFAILAGWKGTTGKFVVVHRSDFGNAPVTYTFCFSVDHARVGIVEIDSSNDNSIVAP